MKYNCAYALALCSMLLASGVSRAQFQNAPGGGRGAVSPYLNLLRGGEPAVNYYGLVRPQIAAGKAFQQIGVDIATLDNAANQQNQALQPIQTGHVSSFMTHGRYFMNNGATGSGQGRQSSLQTGGTTRHPTTGR